MDGLLQLQHLQPDDPSAACEPEAEPMGATTEATEPASRRLNGKRKGPFPEPESKANRSSTAVILF